MSQKKISQIQEARNKVTEIRNIAADAVERFDEALLAWTLAWNTYLTLEMKPNKTESQIADTIRVYKEMCLVWKIYQKECLASNEACLAAFNASANLYLLMQKEKLN